jgi:peptidoglycan-associated lipoprotein
MKQFCLVLLGFSSLLTIAACHKTVPVAASNTPAPPAASAPPARPESRPSPSPAPVKAAVRTPANNPVRNAATPARLTPQDRATLNDRLTRLSDALFDYDKATIRPDAATVLKSDVDVIRDILSNYPKQKLVIEGHADERGSDEYNMALGDKRAETAEEFLGMMGVSRSQLTVISYGKERPVCTQQNENCWQKNRRVHITAAP